MMKEPINRYVLGFVFRDNGTSVVLIRKLKPAWQRGLLNGVGGKVEPGEPAERAMSREFFEECGVAVQPANWRHFARMSGDEWSVDCFTLRDSDVWDRAATTESEEIEKIHPDKVNQQGCVSNLHWLIELALDENDGKNHFANIRYSKPYLWRFDDMSKQTKIGCEWLSQALNEGNGTYKP